MEPPFSCWCWRCDAAFTALLYTYLLPSHKKNFCFSFQATLRGDRWAAELVLLWALSRVHSRSQQGAGIGGGAVGSFALALSGALEPSGALAPPTTRTMAPPPPATAKPTTTAPSLGSAAGLCALLSQLLPKCVLLPLSVDVLNKGPFAPTKDYARNCLRAGPLQLSRGTHLVVDETAMRAGSLSSVGLKNLDSLKRVISEQEVQYDFQYHQQTFPCDIPVLVVAAGKPLLVQDNVPGLTWVPLRPTAASSGGPVPSPPADESLLLAACREFLSALRCLDLGAIDVEVSRAAELDFVAARKAAADGHGVVKGPNKVDGADFARWITLARLLALSHGEETLTLGRWREARALEIERLARCKSAMAAAPAPAPMGGRGAGMVAAAAAAAGTTAPPPPGMRGMRTDS